MKKEINSLPTRKEGTESNPTPFSNLEALSAAAETEGRGGDPQAGAESHLPCARRAPRGMRAVRRHGAGSHLLSAGAGRLGTADATLHSHPALGRDAAGCPVRTDPEGGWGATSTSPEFALSAGRPRGSARKGAPGPPRSALPRRLRAGRAWHRGSRVGRGGRARGAGGGVGAARPRCCGPGGGARCLFNKLRGVNFLLSSGCGGGVC